MPPARFWCDQRHTSVAGVKLLSLTLFPAWGLIMPTDLPAAASVRRRKAVADNITVVSVWVIIWLAMIVLALLLADQSFSSPTTEWKYLF
jgi:hypothetical protein